MMSRVVSCCFLALIAATGDKIRAGKYLLTVRIEGCGFACSPAVSRTIYVVSP